MCVPSRAGLGRPTTVSRACEPGRLVRMSEARSRRPKQEPPRGVSMEADDEIGRLRPAPTGPPSAGRRRRERGRRSRKRRRRRARNFVRAPVALVLSSQPVGCDDLPERRSRSGARGSGGASAIPPGMSRGSGPVGADPRESPDLRSGRTVVSAPRFHRLRAARAKPKHVRQSSPADGERRRVNPIVYIR